MFIQIETIPNNIKNMNHISKNRHNVLSNQEFNILHRDLKHLFIDPDLMKYKIEFISNCVALVPFDTWMILILK